MKKTIFVVVALAALVASSVAVATPQVRQSSAPVSATLSAPTTVHLNTRTADV